MAIVDKNILSSAEADGEAVGWIKKTGVQNADGHQEGAVQVTIVSPTGSNVTAGVKGTKAFYNGAVTDAAAVLIVAANANRLDVAIRNSGDDDMWLGKDNTVLENTGFLLPAGEAINDTNSVDAWYGRCKTADATSFSAVETSKA